jgi:RNA polymerase sigma factor (sigma-70 family)
VEYEHRLSNPQLAGWLLPTDRPRWQGEEFGGKTILLQSEQGYGDTLQFVRYAPLVKARGGHVVLRAPRALLPLLKTVAGIDAVIGPEDKGPPFDLHLPLLSLPLIFATQPDTVPTAYPYLVPDPERVAHWRERLGTHGGLSIGLVWQGNPAHPNDRRRSIPLDYLRPLLDCPGVRFVSLQVGPGQEQLIGLENRIVDAGARIDASSFADASAIIANLDLVISIDSAIAHLAGALGKPVWIMLATASDWRWLSTREDTPWYPQMRLFRQKVAGGWAELVQRLRTALWAFAGAALVPIEECGPTEQHADPVAAVTRRLAATTRTGGPTICDALFVEACRQYRAKNVERSRRLFLRVLSLDPTHVNTLCNLGALELGLGRGHRALELLQTAIVLAPDLAPARTALADTLRDEGKVEQALAQYRKAIELAPNSADVHVAYAKSLQKIDGGSDTSGMKGEAIRPTIHQHFRRALELAPGDAAVHAEYALALHRMLITRCRSSLRQPRSIASNRRSSTRLWAAPVLRAITRKARKSACITRLRSILGAPARIAPSENCILRSHVRAMPRRALARRSPLMKPMWRRRVEWSARAARAALQCSARYRDMQRQAHSSRIFFLQRRARVESSGVVTVKSSARPFRGLRRPSTHRDFMAMSLTLGRNRAAKLRRGTCWSGGRGRAMSYSNQAALLTLLVANYDEIRQSLARRAGSADLADEAMQDTFLRLSSATVVGPIGDLRAYLFRVAMSVVSNRRVAERRHLSVSGVDAIFDAVDESPNPERIAEARSEINALKRVIQELPGRRREILVAAFVAEVPLRDIAARFGVSVRTIQVELKRALVHCAMRLDRDARKRGPAHWRKNAPDQRRSARDMIPLQRNVLARRLPVGEGR